MTRRWHKWIGGLVGAGTAVLAYSTLLEPRWYALRHVTVPVLRPPAGRPLRILHLSDLHLLPGQEHKHAFIRRCLRHGPDAVVLTGDIIGHPDGVDSAVELLGEVGEGRLAVAVLGSNDRYHPVPKNPLRYFAGPSEVHRGRRLDTDRLMSELAGAGWNWMDNRRVRLETPAGVVDLAGLGDAHIGADRPDRVDWTAPGEQVALRLGVAHAPYLRVLDVFDRSGYDLVLAGHTHGGQVRIPFVGALVDNCDLPLRQARGLSRHGADLWLHVSAGLGAAMFAPIRFSCRPEATLLDLVPAEL